MNATLHPDIQLADGFRLTDHLDAPYCLASGHLFGPCSAIVVSDLNGIKLRELLIEDTTRNNLSTCFSPDDSTLYAYDTRLWAMNVATGAVQYMPDLPHTPGFDKIGILECSPDNRTLLLSQTTIPQMTRGSGPVMPKRLCRISTQGTDFRILYEDPAECWMGSIACEWRQGFAILRRSTQAGHADGDELWKLDLNSGERTLLCQAVPFGWKHALRPDGTKIVWSSLDNEIYTYSLVDGVTRLIPVQGTYPIWSPDGRWLAYMRDEYMLCVWDMERGKEQPLVWFAPPHLSFKQRGSSYAVAPVWSPDGKMLWFSLTHTRRMPSPRNHQQVLKLAKWIIRPILHNLNPSRTSNFVSYRHLYHVQKTGIVDLNTRQVKLSDGFEYGVKWLPYYFAGASDTIGGMSKD